MLEFARVQAFPQHEQQVGGVRQGMRPAFLLDETARIPFCCQVPQRFLQDRFGDGPFQARDFVIVMHDLSQEEYGKWPQEDAVRFIFTDPDFQVCQQVGDVDSNLLLAVIPAFEEVGEDPVPNFVA